MANPEGDASLGALVAKQLAKAQGELVAELEGVSNTAQRASQDLALVLQEWMVAQEGPWHHLEATMGVGEKSAGEQSAFNFVTAALPASFQNLQDTAHHDRAVLTGTVESLAAALRTWEQNVQQTSRLALGQARAATVNAISERSQELQELVAKAEFRYAELGDQLKR